MTTLNPFTTRFRALHSNLCDAPVLLIHGSDSPPVMAEICEAIAGRLPDVGVASVPGAGHMLPLTHARQLSDLIALNLERS